MGESERKGKEAGELKASCQKETFINEGDPVTVLVWVFYSQTPFTKYQKNQKQKLLQGDKTGRKPKRDKSQKVKKKYEQCFRGENSHPAKFRNPAPFLILCFLLLFSSGF